MCRKEALAGPAGQTWCAEQHTHRPQAQEKGATIIPYPHARLFASSRKSPSRRGPRGSVDPSHGPVQTRARLDDTQARDRFNAPVTAGEPAAMKSPRRLIVGVIHLRRDGRPRLFSSQTLHKVQTEVETR